jgi:hypothetical protein
MKTKYFRILGVVLIVAMLASIFGIATPAAAADVSWTPKSGPGTIAATGWTINAGSDVSLLTVSPDGGTLFAVDNTTNTVYRSTDGGSFWAAAVAPLPAAIVAMVVSPQFDVDSTVIVATATAVYKSTNGGVSFVQMSATLTTTEVYTSLAISPTFSTDGLLLAGTADPAAGAFGSVYVWGRPATFGWMPVAATVGPVPLAADVTSVAFSPNFPVDFTVLAVGSTAANTSLYGAVGWGNFGAVIPTAVINTSTDVGAAGGIASSAMAPVSTYNGIVVTSRRVYVATSDAVAPGNNNVYRVTATTSTALGLTAVPVASMAYSGDYSTGTLIAGSATSNAVFRCANPAAPAGWLFLPASQAPTGATGTQVALAADFATSNRIYVGTSGAGAGDESAVSISDDGGATFYQVGLIDTIVAAIRDVTPSPAYATDSIIFMVTSNGLATGVDSLWKNDGKWKRIWAANTVNDNAMVLVSPNFSTDQCVVVAQIGGTTGAISVSMDGGASWGAFPFTSPLPIADMVMETPTIFYVAGNAGGVTRTANSGWTWTPSTGLTAAGPLFSMHQAPNGDILVGSTGGLVYRSTNGAISFAAISGPTGLTNVLVAFDGNYATNSTVYAAGGTLGGIWRFTIGTSTTWTDITTVLPGQATVAAGACTALKAAADGTLYATDVAAATPTTGGMLRCLNPTSPAPTVERVSAGTLAANVGDNLTTGATLADLEVVAGSNLVVAMSTAAAPIAPIHTYIDTLTVAPVLSLDATTTGTAVFSWAALPGGTSYAIQLNTREDFRGTFAGTWSYLVGETTGNVTGLAAGATYYARLRVANAANTAGYPVYSPYSVVVKVQMRMATPGAVTIVGPAPSATNVPINTSLSWGAVAGAASYTVDIADNPNFDDAISGETPVNAFKTPENLAYSTTYYWRVTANSATGAPVSTPLVNSFTTEAEPEEPGDITVQPSPPPDVTIEYTPPVEEPDTPGYIWAIVGIGAVLVVVVLVLIWMTRRTRV